MVCRHSLLTGFLAALSVLVSSCSDDGSSPDKGEPSAGEESSLPYVGGSVMFTEVDPVNISYSDHEGDDDGWVELVNMSNDFVDLSGMYLTDSKSCI